MGRTGHDVVVAESREDRLRDLAHRATPAVASFLARRAYPLSNADIDDLVEEVLVVAWRRLDDIPRDAEIAWMIGVARNVLNNARRKHSRRLNAHHKLMPEGPDASAEDNVIANEQLRGALESLRSEDQEVLLLHYWEGLDAPALGVVLGVTAGAAATRLSRASTRLREAFTEFPDSGDKESLERTRRV
jgi:RNA polymerase sigma factor (sigma-70 family)